MIWWRKNKLSPNAATQEMFKGPSIKLAGIFCVTSHSKGLINPLNPFIIIKILITGFHTHGWVLFVNTSTQSIFGDCFPNSHNLYVF